MATTHLALLFMAIAIIAFLYSSVGHAGASGYIAVMTLLGLAPATIRPTALILNILVATIGSIQFGRAGYFRWRLFWPFALLSIPAAYLGGYLQLPAVMLRILIGLVLLFSAGRLFFRRSDPPDLQSPSPPEAISLGGIIGLLSGLTLTAAVEQVLGRALAAPALPAVQKRKGWLRGLYCGGTLCNEAQLVLMRAGAQVRSNVPVPGALEARDLEVQAHCLIDLGDDEYTRGRAHPMIDPESRNELILKTLARTDVAVVLLDSMAAAIWAGRRSCAVIPCKGAKRKICFLSIRNSRSSVTSGNRGSPKYFRTTFWKFFDDTSFAPDVVTLWSHPLRPVVSKCISAADK